MWAYVRMCGGFFFCEDLLWCSGLWGEMREAFTGWLGRRIRLPSRNRSPSWTQRAWRFLRVFFGGFFSFFFLSGSPRSSTIQLSFEAEDTSGPTCSYSRACKCTSMCVCLCTLLALCVFTRLDYCRDVIHALHSRAAPKLFLDSVLEWWRRRRWSSSSHTKKIGLSSRFEECVRVCPKKRKKRNPVRFLPNGSDIYRHRNHFGLFFLSLRKKKNVFLHVCVSVHACVCVCVIVYLCACLRVCLWIEMFSYSCEKCSQLLPHSEVETDGSRWRETK